MHLTSAHAQSVIAAAQAKAREMGLPVVIAIIDAGTHLKAFERMDGAVLGSIDIAVRKAKTAALFEADSESVWEYCKPGAPAHALELTNSGLAPFGGGMPLRARDGRLIGALGISGGAVSQDVEVAQAGLAAFEAAIRD
ncbi:MULTISPECIES: GlcG/HbpS family heme-binding protein [unclassified Variovorax]|uniref:GlcG/HbpS family heme-binding protein n=1 Tax=unclassified Variovorax TaxID=663243 RepID=UPI003ED0FBB8